MWGVLMDGSRRLRCRRIFCSRGCRRLHPRARVLGGRGKGKAVEGDGDVEMLDGDEDLQGMSTLLI